MTHWNRLLIAACVTVCLSYVVFAQGIAPASTDRMKAWEHLAMAVDAANAPGDAETSRRIVQLGGEGWELVDVETIVKDGSTTKLIYFFKRPK